MGAKVPNAQHIDPRIYSILSAAFRANVDEQMLKDSLNTVDKTDSSKSRIAAETSVSGHSEGLLASNEVINNLTQVWENHKQATVMNSTEFISIELLGIVQSIIFLSFFG